MLVVSLDYTVCVCVHVSEMLKGGETGIMGMCSMYVA